MRKRERAAPAFQFYPSDFMAGAPGRMAPDETHVYVWLLCLDWTAGGFSFDEDDLARWCRVSTAKFRRAWEKVGPNFTEREGRLYNPRLDKERAKQAEWRQKSREGGLASAHRRGKGGSTTVGTKQQPPLNHPTNHRGNQRSTLQTSVRVEDSVESSTSRVSSKAGALDGARAQREAALEEENRHREARGEPPLTYREAYG